jgi:hypothetical protein
VPKARPGSTTTASAPGGGSSHGGPTQSGPIVTAWWELGLPDLNQQRRYRYELRSSSATLATGHLTQPEPLEVGDMIEIGGSAGIIRAVEPILGEHELRLVVQLVSTLDNSET